MVSLRVTHRHDLPGCHWSVLLVVEVIVEILIYWRCHLGTISIVPHGKAMSWSKEGSHTGQCMMRLRDDENETVVLITHKVCVHTHIIQAAGAWLLTVEVCLVCSVSETCLRYWVATQLKYAFKLCSLFITADVRHAESYIVSVIRFTFFKELCYTVGIVSPGNQLNSMYDEDHLMSNPFNSIVQSGRTDIIAKCYSQQFLSHYFANDS